MFCHNKTLSFLFAGSYLCSKFDKVFLLEIERELLIGIQWHQLKGSVTCISRITTSYYPAYREISNMPKKWQFALATD